MEAQFSTVYGIAVNNFDGDGKADILLGGNFYQSKPEAGIYDASYGLFLKGNGTGNFKAVTSVRSGFFIKGAVKDIISIKPGNQFIYQVIEEAVNAKLSSVLN